MTSDKDLKAAEEYVRANHDINMLRSEPKLAKYGEDCFLAGRSSALKELEQVAREAFEAGKDSTQWDGRGFYFTDWLASKLQEAKQDE